MKNAGIWILAIVITLAGVYYTRTTGPTKPARGVAEISGEQIRFSLIRTWLRDSDANVKVKVDDPSVTGSFIYKRTPSNDQWSQSEMARDGEYLVASIPQQPHAGKIMYQITLIKDNEVVKLTENPVVIRFRGDVPAWAMVPHIILMFAALLLSTRAGLAAVFRQNTYLYSLLTFTTLVAGGLVFGPIVQKYAFGDWWTGWPFGTDLTDNKTAIMVVVWAFALFKVYKNKQHRGAVLFASIILMLVYLIPHSMMGSEIDFKQE